MKKLKLKLKNKLNSIKKRENKNLCVAEIKANGKRIKKKCNKSKVHSNERSGGITAKFCQNGS